MIDNAVIQRFLYQKFYYFIIAADAAKRRPYDAGQSAYGFIITSAFIPISARNYLSLQIMYFQYFARTFFVATHICI